MKKILLILLLLTGTLATKAQFTTGWDNAMNFGGAGADVEEMRYVNGDLYFVARMMGKYQFAGTNYDAGAILTYPDQDVIFGKITSSGTQVLIQRFKSADLSAVSSSARIGVDGSFYIFRLGYGTEKTFGSVTAPAYGLQLLKMAPNGQFDWVKKISTFSDIEFGTTGVANPTFGGMQLKDNGEVYAIFASNTIRGAVYAARVIKFNATGDEVWHYEMTNSRSGSSLSGTIISNMPKKFVDDNGNLTFKVATTGTISFSGETLPYEEPYTYAGYGNLKNWIISLDNTGQKKWSTSAYVEPTFYGVNPTNGEIYINYQYVRTSPVVAASIAPFSSLPNLAPPPAPYVVPAYSWSGIITLNTSGGIVKTKSNYANATAYPTQMQMADNGRILLYTATANGNVFKAGNNFITFQASGYAAMEVDADFNPLTVFKLPAGSTIALDNNKFAFGGSFKTQTTIGSTTLTPYFIDTDFNTRFPNWASIKADVLIAQGNLDNIPTELVSTTWLGTNTNWNDAANWSNGVPSTDTKAVFDANTANMPLVATTPKAGQIVINSGVTASLPAALVVTDKIINNGVLSINNALSYYSFTGYSAKGIEGNGELFFNGTAAGAITYAGITGPTTNTISLNHAVQLSAKVKDIKFIGTTAMLTGTMEVTSAAADAITGYSATSHIRGSLTRAINQNGVYVFPTDGYGPFEPVTLTLNNLTGTNKITVSNPSGTFTPDLAFANGVCNKTLGDYYWKITSDVAPTGGNYDVSFTKSTFTNGVTDADRYVVLSRADNKSYFGFEGVKIASTQTGGTINGQVVSNADVTAGLSGLTKFSEFVIGINSVPVPNGTAVTSTTWTGNLNTAWDNAGNWTNGVPNATVNASIPAGLTNYPALYPSKPSAKSLAVDAGVTTLRLTHTLSLTNGLINNGSIEVFEPNSTVATFFGFNGNITGNGTIRFEANSLIARLSNSMGTNNIEVNVGNANDFNLSAKISGNINIKSGKITSFLNNQQYLELTNPNSTITIASTDHAIAAQKMSRAVNTSGTYKFPISCYPTYNGRKYGEVEITNNAIAAATVYAVNLDSEPTKTIGITNGSDVISSFINSGLWLITPTTFSTTGTIDLTLKTSGFTNGRVDVNDYVLLRLDAASGWKVISSATITQNAGLITVNANGIAPFGSAAYFCIGIKATTTTWTGNGANTNWSTAANWSNGVPSATVKAVIPNSTKYPTNIPTSGTAAAAVEIGSGSIVTLPATFYTPVGIVNNGTINISGSGTFFGFGSGTSFSNLSGTGKLVFGNDAPAILDSYYMNNNTQVVDNSIEINRTGGISLVRPTTFTGNVTLTSGSVTVPDFSYPYFIMDNPNATILGSATGYIKGMLKRTVNASGTYSFPVGAATAYAPASLVLTGLVGTTNITTNFSSAAISDQPNLTISGQTVNSILTGGSWFITPNAQPTAGTYTATLSAPIGSSTANNYYVLKRADNNSYYQWANLGTNATSTVTSGVVTASTSGLTSFSQFGIGEGFGALPVKLVKFLASADAKFAKLYWETASELNNDKFEIERSTNGTDFIKIGEVKGNGTSGQLNTYGFRDLAPQNGVNYYRLKQLDSNGNSEFSETRAVKFDLRDVVFSVYPNPTTDFINFSEAVKSVEIYTLNGAKVYEQTGTLSSVKIPSSIKSGLYIVKATLLEGSSVSKQIIIN